MTRPGPLVPIVGILLTAGSGSRFGGDKMLHPLADGTPMAVATARQLRSSCNRTLAVVRPGSSRLAELIVAEGIDVVISPESVHGMGHSLATGIRASRDAGAWIIALGDMPFIDPSSYRCVASALLSGAVIAAPEHDGQRGHPVGFASCWYDKLSTLNGDEGARSLLKTMVNEIVLCPVQDKGILRDVDSRADLM